MLKGSSWSATAMNLTIELPEELGALLKAKADAQGVSTNRYIGLVLQHALASEIRTEPSSQPFETGYGMWAQYGPAPSAEEIDENRREMFQNFAQDF
jgi:hypothetical protein